MVLSLLSRSAADASFAIANPGAHDTTSTATSGTVSGVVQEIIGRRLSLFFPILVVMESLAMSPAQATPVGPASYSIQFDGVPGAINEDEYSPQSGSYSFFGGTLDVDASASTTAQPAASVTVTSGGCTSGFPGSGCAGGYYDVIAQVYYYIMASGPTGVMVPYYFHTAGGVTANGESADAQAEVDLIAPGGEGLGGFQSSTFVNDGATYCNSSCVNGTQHINLLSNTPYTIEITAGARVFTNYPSSAMAWTDPYIYIDPTFVGGNNFSLLISNGIGNTPSISVSEPSTWSMLLLGVAGLGLMAYRHKLRGSVRRELGA